MGKKETKTIKIKQNIKGITLIALVVTIVVLLILATVSINLVLSNQGIVAKARDAANAYKIAEANEIQGLSELADEMDIASGKQVIKDVSFADAKNRDPATSTTIAKVTIGSDTVYVPAKFKISSDSATSVSNGIVIEDTDGNQYVWIPCTIDGANGSIKYDRYAFTRDGWFFNQTKTGDTITENNYSGNFTETIDSVEQTSVNKYGGFYIGRYEAGDGVSTTAKTLRTYSTSKTNAVTVKKAQAPYNYVTRDQAKTLAEGIKSANNYTGITASKLCSSYAYDTALKFIDAKDSGYSTNSTQENCYDLSFTYKDMSGTSQTKAVNTSTLIPTGETTPEANIYDLGGNVLEWTTEAYGDSDYPCVDRGGDCVDTSSDHPAGTRDIGDTTFSGNVIGFRPTLYL